MIIKSIYIEKFGGLKNKKIEFSDGINILYAENEFGKSTIAEFIRLMLYGQTKSSQNIRDNERKKFIPWDDKSMGGEIVIIKDSTEFIISRTFGKRKSDDKISVINNITGATVNELCIESPGEVLFGVGREGFEKSLYIKQLSTKIETNKDDEIIKKLVNLTQSGDESVSYQRAIQILDSNAKELNGSRPRGKILLVQDEISKLHSEKVKAYTINKQNEEYKIKLTDLQNKKSVLENTFVDYSLLEKSKEIYAEIKKENEIKKHMQKQFETSKEEQLTKIKKATTAYIISLIISIFLCITLFFYIGFSSALVLIISIFCLIMIIKTLKQKKECNLKEQIEENSENIQKLFEILKIDDLNVAQDSINKLEQSLKNKEKQITNELVDIAQQIGDYQNKVSSSSFLSIDTIDEMIQIEEEKINNYNDIINDINCAKKALKYAFDELQQSFGRKLNIQTAEILKAITNSKYSEVFVDEQYNMMVRDCVTNQLIDAQYLSSGAYDQIYFSLRMAIKNILFENMPIILDDAFTQYDDYRLKLVLEYLKVVCNNTQILLFSCHKRECEILKQQSILN